MKLLIENWRKYLQEDKLQEATEEEIGYLQDLLEMPPSVLPFDSFFNGKYRKFETIKVNTPGSPLSQLDKLLEFTGWSMLIEDVGNKKAIMASKLQKRSYTDKDGNLRVSTSLKKMKITKLIAAMQRAFSFTSLDQTRKLGEETHGMENLRKMAYNRVRDEFGEITEENIEEYKAALNAVTDKYEVEVEKRRKAYAKKISSLEFLGGTSYIPTLERRRGEVETVSEFILDGSRLADLTTNLESYRQDNFIIYSRHPIDVYRMSDHRNLDSCHSLPSFKGDARFDQYNICALSEAHGNGLIAYMVPTDQVREFLELEEGQPITPEVFTEKLDEFELPGEEGEIFEDDDRNVSGMVPVSRVRIKNVAYNNSESEGDPIKLLVPQGNVYGQKLPGLVEKIYQTTVEGQKEKLEKIKELEGEEIKMFSFTRYGGSYQDSGYRVKDSLPKMFDVAFPGESFSFYGSINYSHDMEEELRAEAGGMTEQMIAQEIDAAIDALGVPNNVDVNYEVEEHDFGEFSISVELAVRFEMEAEGDFTLAQARTAEDEIDDKAESFFDAFTGGEMGTVVDRVTVGAAFGDKITIEILINSELVQYCSGGDYLTYEEIGYQLDNAFTGIDRGRFSHSGLNNAFDRFGPLQGYVLRGLQEADILTGGNEYKMAQFAWHLVDDNPSDFEYDFSIYYDDDTGDEMSDGYEAKAEYVYQTNDEDDAKIVALLARAYGTDPVIQPGDDLYAATTSEGSDILRGQIAQVVYAAMGGPDLKLPIAKMRIYFQFVSSEDEEYSGEQYREVTYKIGFVANDYDFQKKSDIESHIMALKMYGDWTEVNEGLTNFINDNPQLGLGGTPSTPEPEPELDPAAKAERAEQLKQAAAAGMITPRELKSELEKLTESKKRIKLRVLRG